MDVLRRNYRPWLTAIARALAWVGVVVCALGAVALFVAIIFIWQFRASLRDQVATGTAQIDQVLGQADARLGAVSAGVTTVDLAQDTQIGQSIVGLTGVVVGINDTLVAVNRMPGISVPTIQTSKLAGVASRYMQVATALASGAAAQSVQGAAESGRQEITEARDQVARFGAAAALWINRGAIILTIFCLWMGIAQISLCRHAWVYARRGG